MQKIKFAVAFALIAATTAACVETTTTTTTRYPNQAYRNTNSNSGYWNSPRADYDRDGVPNRYDRDANGDRIPDRYQGR
jgi:hypothetical protein